MRAGRAAAVVLPELLSRRTAVVRSNLRLAFGRAEPRLVRATYRHFAEAAVDVLFFRRIFSLARFSSHFRLEGDGWSHYRRSQPHGAVFVTGHFGNWELFAAVFRHVGIPIAPVVRPPDLAWFARRVEAWRRAMGEEPIPKRNALPLALKAVRKGRAVVFLNDQAAGQHGIPLPFLGQPAFTFTAPAALAKKLDVPLYAGYSTRLGDGIRYRCHAEQVSTEGDIETVTRRLNGILEGYVRARPEQWWWFHRRFKRPRSSR